MSNRSRRNLICTALCLLFSGSLAAPSRALITAGALDLPGARDVEVVEGLAYVVIGSGFDVVDVSNPGEPVALSTFPTEGLATSAAVVDGLLYLGVSGRDHDDPTTLRAIDVSNPHAPVELGSIEFVDWRKGVSDIVVVDGIV